jgi:hypothetical protein
VRPAVPAETPQSHRTDGLTWPRISCGTNSVAAKSALNDKFYTMHQPEADAVSGASPVQDAAALPGGARLGLQLNLEVKNGSNKGK